jgi:hypothetical protein
MPRDKDLKRLVRARMHKTGEAYTTARAQIMKKSRAKTTSRPVPRPAAEPAGPTGEYAALAGMSDDAIERKTGRTWARWVEALDGHGAQRMSHRDIAALVNRQYQLGGWWSQSVTVGYERIKGLRARGQRRDGTYEASRSRTFNVPVTTLFEAWADAPTRRRWLKEPGVRVRTAAAPKSIRLGWPDGGIVAVGFLAKGASKSAVAVQHTKLPDRDAANRLKQYWSERLDALGEVLAER